MIKAIALHLALLSLGGPAFATGGALGELKRTTGAGSDVAPPPVGEAVSVGQKTGAAGGAVASQIPSTCEALREGALFPLGAGKRPPGFSLAPEQVLGLANLVDHGCESTSRSSERKSFANIVQRMSSFTEVVEQQNAGSVKVLRLLNLEPFQNPYFVGSIQHELVFWPPNPKGEARGHITLKETFQTGQYESVVTWRFFYDGEIEPRAHATGGGFKKNPWGVVTEIDTLEQRLRALIKKYQKAK